MGYAEKIYERIKQLPEQAAREVLDFAEFVASRRAGTIASAAQATRPNQLAEIEKTFSKYQIDLSNVKFDREEANARR